MSKLIIALIWGWISRMAGGAPPKLLYGLDAWLYALPYAIICLPSFWSIPAYLIAALGKRLGHGRGISLKAPLIGEPEKIEWLTIWVKPYIPVYWYKVLILSATGLVCSLVAGIICGSWIIALSGLLKGPAYMIGWAIYPKGTGRGIKYLNEATAIGEFLTGFLCIGVLLGFRLL